MGAFEDLMQAAYLQENGLKLLLGAGSGFAPEEVISSQIRMLQANRVPGVLPFQAEMADGRYRFRYELTGQRSLTAALRSERMADSAARAWLLQLAHTFLKAGEYLLDEEGFILLPEYIWVERGKETGSICLLYVPLRREKDNFSLWHQWNRLYYFLLLNGVSKAAIEAVNPLQWTAETFSLQLLAEAIEPSEEAQKYLAADAFVVEDQVPASSLTTKREQIPTSEDGETMHFSRPELLNLKNLFAVLSGICVLAFLATREWIWLGAALGCLIALLPSVKWKAAIWTQKDRSIKQGSGTCVSEIPSVLPPEPLLSPVLSTLPKASLELGVCAEIEGTTLLSPPADETVLLDASVVSGLHGCEAWLEVHSPGETEGNKVLLSEESCFVGRGPQGVHIVANHPGISRIHVEIRRDTGGFIALDAGSKNGTFLNTEPMVAFQHYPLSQGDTIRLPGMHLVYHQQEIR